MPNHVKNELTFLGSAADVSNIMDAISSGEDVIDFNKIVPIPKSMNITADGHVSSICNEYNSQPIKMTLDQIRAQIAKHGRMLRSPESDEIDVVENFIAAVRNYIDHGYASWSEANRAIWGTKWNAYEQARTSENTITFETAWSPVTELIRKLSAKFPKVEIIYRYADEDTGCNCGEGKIVNGESFVVVHKNKSRQAYELAFKLRPDRKECFTQDADGEYQRVDCDEREGC